jgi:hypothetical protein
MRLCCRRLSRAAAIALLAWIVAAHACALELEVELLPAAEARAQAARWHGLPLAHGQLVVTHAAQPDSLFLRLFEPRFFAYTHIGIVAVEDEGEPYVYDANTRGWGSDGQRLWLEGGVRRLRFTEFAATLAHGALYGLPPGVDAERVVTAARALYARKPDYDSRFDASDSSRVYCSEFVALALRAAGGGPIPLAPFATQPAVQRVLRALGVEVGQVVPVAVLVAPAPELARFSKAGRLQQREADVAIEYELWRRFGADQRLGFLFSLDAGGLRYREPVASFVQAARALAQRLPPAEQGRAVAELALRWFAEP